MEKNIHPIFEKLHSRSDREQQLQQHATVVWLTGLSGAGKSTVARALEHELFLRGFKCFVLHGDNMRIGINKNLGFTDADRNENIRRVAEIAKLFIDAGITVLCSFITPLESQRKMASQIIGEKDFFLTYLSTPINVCETRDVKGLYALARQHKIEYFTGVNAPFEAPLQAQATINTENKTVFEVTDILLQAILPIVTYKNAQPEQYNYYNI